VVKSSRFAPHARVAVKERGRISSHKSLRIRSEYLSALVPRGTEYVAAHGSCHAENLGRSKADGLRLLRLRGFRQAVQRCAVRLQIISLQGRGMRPSFASAGLFFSWLIWMILPTSHRPSNIVEIPMLRDYRTSGLFAQERCDSLTQTRVDVEGSIA